MLKILYSELHQFSAMRRFFVEDPAPLTRPVSEIVNISRYFPSLLSKAHLDEDTDLAEGRHREQNTLPHSPQVRFLEMKENLVPHMSQVTAGGELWSRSELL